MEQEAENLKKRFAGINRAEFARTTSFKGGPALIYQHITGRRPISLEAAQAYADGFGCSLDEISPRLALETKNAARRITKISAQDLSNVEAAEPAGTVPLISWVQAGSWCEASDIYNVGDAEEWLSCPVRHGPRTYALRVRGESMRNPGSKPSFEDGDIIFVDPDLGATHKSLVITKLDQSNEVTFKRLLIDGANWYLEAINPAWPNRIIPVKTDAHVCGVVIARLESFI